MIKHKILHNEIQEHVMTVLSRQEVARFNEIRPSSVDTNVFSYHLKVLVRDGFITKFEKGYMLGVGGLLQIGKASGDTSKPHVTAMLLIQNSEGQILLQKKTEQPYINTLTLPNGTVQTADRSIDEAMKRIGLDELGLRNVAMRHVGDGYVRVSNETVAISTTLIHIFRCEIDESFSDESLIWVEPIRLHTYHLAPAIEQIIARSFFGDKHFFAEFEHEWTVA